MKTHLLIIEDEPQLYTLMKMALAPLGFETHYSESTEDLPAKVKELQAKIVVTDFLMPVRNGLDVAKILRDDAETANIPIVLLTSKELLMDEVKAVAALKLDYLRKPFMPQVLSAKLKEILSRFSD